MAACHNELVFAKHCDAATPLPCQLQLHGWLEDSTGRLRRAAPGDEYQSAIDLLLPANTNLFFNHYSTTATSNLQTTLNAKATKYHTEAAVQQMRWNERGASGDKWSLAHQQATSAGGAWTWKVTRPEGPHLRLSDVEYAVAARLSLGLQPFSPLARTMLPPDCPLCRRRALLNTDPWHWLVCTNSMKGELARRHDAVVDAISRVARQVGAQVRTEVKGLDLQSRKRPDLRIVVQRYDEGRADTSPRRGGRRCLSNGTAGRGSGEDRGAGTGSAQQPASSQHARLSRASAAGRRVRVPLAHPSSDHQRLRSRHSAIQEERKVCGRGHPPRCLGLLNLAVDSCGGMAPGASRLIEAIAEEGARWSAGTWTEKGIQRQLLGAIATAVQRGNGMAMLAGYTRAMARVRQESGHHTGAEGASGSVSGEETRGEE